MINSFDFYLRSEIDHYEEIWRLVDRIADRCSEWQDI